MFTFRPSKNGNGHSAANGSGQKNGNGVYGHGNGANGNGHKNGNGNGHGGKIETVLGPGIHYKGTLNGAAGVRIEGAFDGSINVKGPVVITDGAKVTADIQASVVSVGGSLKGNITAGKVEILSTGRVWGDLMTSAFATEEGAFLRGAVKMEDQIPEPVEAAPPQAVLD
ncbi:MAG: bactofilin family protein [Anaerolineales bacterium]